VPLRDTQIAHSATYVNSLLYALASFANFRSASRRSNSSRRYIIKSLTLFAASFANFRSASRRSNSSRRYIIKSLTLFAASFARSAASRRHSLIPLNPQHTITHDASVANFRAATRHSNSSFATHTNQLHSVPLAAHAAHGTSFR
jgi:hypothetical protein